MPRHDGHFGRYGGRYVPETLMPALEELDAAYRQAVADPAFQAEFRSYLHSYCGRPTPLYRADHLTEELGGATIYLKREDLNHTGSHKINNALGQILLARRMGKRRVIAETGAGQHGVGTATACALLGLECVVYMVKVSYNQKPYRKMMMHTWGAEVYSSPSENTEFGRKVLQDDPDCPGSLGIAISEAIEDTVRSQATKYSLGSVLNHVLLHQTVIGQESIRQMEMAGEAPDVIIGCVGGGSNFAGLAFPFIEHKLTKGANYRIIAVEPTACPTMTRGEMRYDYGDTAGTTPLLMMLTLGHDFIPPAIHSGGLRYHGLAPMVSHAHKLGLIEARAVPQTQVFAAAVQFAREEGILPAPESAHAIAVAMEEAKAAKAAGQKRVILFGLSGHGMLDLASYEAFLEGKLQDV